MTDPKSGSFRTILIIVGTALLSSLLTAAAVLYLVSRTDLLANLRAGDAAPGGPATSQAESMDEQELARLYEQLSPSVVHVAVATERGGGTGTGFVVSSQGGILTNNHVIQEAESITVILKDGTELPAQIVGRDPATDVALLAVDPPAPLPEVQMGDSEQVRVGELAIVIGNPFGFEQSLTVGYISALGRMLRSGDDYGTEIDGVIQTDAAVNPGNSGGPLLNIQGEVVGITTSIFTTSGGFEGLGFAVPINTARAVAEELGRRGYIRRPFLGISGLDLTPQLARRLSLPVEQGVLVQMIHRGSAADEAGLRPGNQVFDTPIGRIVLGGDVLVAVDGSPVASMAEANRITERHGIGDQIGLEVLRNGQRLILSGELGERPPPERIGPAD